MFDITISKHQRCEMLFLRLGVERLRAFATEHSCYRRVDATFNQNKRWPLTGITPLELLAEILWWSQLDHLFVEPRFVALSQSGLAPRPVKVI